MTWINYSVKRVNCKLSGSTRLWHIFYHVVFRLTWLWPELIKTCVVSTLTPLIECGARDEPTSMGICLILPLLGGGGGCLPRKINEAKMGVNFPPTPTPYIYVCVCVCVHARAVLQLSNFKFITSFGVLL